MDKAVHKSRLGGLTEAEAGTEGGRSSRQPHSPVPASAPVPKPPVHSACFLGDDIRGLFIDAR